MASEARGVVTLGSGRRRPLARFAVRRLLAAVPVVAVASFIAFVLVAASGDPLTELRSRPHVPAATIALRRAELHLDKPIPVRYAIWVGGLIRGDMGRTVDGGDVGARLGRAGPVTLRIVVPALVLGAAISVVLGAASAARVGSVFDQGATALSFVLLSMPSFWLAGIFKDLAIRLNLALGTTILYVTGERSVGSVGGLWPTLADRVGHLVLPTATLALLLMADWSRFVRASTVDALESPYVRTARAKGVGERRVISGHALRNSLVPFSVVVGLDAGQLLGGAVVTELVFGWHGLGQVLVDGLVDNDVNLVAGWLLIGCLAVIVLNLVADIVHTLLDPRVEL